MVVRKANEFAQILDKGDKIWFAIFNGWNL
jgi:hypothetical protein